MAMMKCPECGKDISDLASSCPNCGFPIGYESTTNKNTTNYSYSEQSNNPYPNAIPVNTYAQPEKKENKTKNSTLGVWALIFSILGCTFIIGVILAVIDLCKKDGKKKTCSIIALCLCGLWLIIAGIGNNKKNSAEKTASNKATTEANEVPVIEKDDADSEKVSVSPVEEETPEPETKDKYYVGDSWENKTLRMTYTNCYEFTDYNQFNTPSAGNKIICAEFEFENIGDSDTTVMYTDFHGYADGYEVSQSYAPEGTGLEFTVKMSAGRKGTGKVAFEVPKDAQEIEIEFSPNFWTSENIIFVYE